MSVWWTENFDGVSNKLYTVVIQCPISQKYFWYLITFKYSLGLEIVYRLYNNEIYCQKMLQNADMKSFISNFWSKIVTFLSKKEVAKTLIAPGST